MWHIYFLSLCCVLFTGLILLSFRKRKPSPLSIILRERLHNNPDDIPAIAALEMNPGFQALLNRLNLQKAAIEARLIRTHHKDLREVDFLQNGLLWLDYLRNECDRAIGFKNKSQEAPPTTDEMEQFNKINAFIERVS